MTLQSTINSSLQRGFNWFLPDTNPYSDFDLSKLKIINSIHFIFLSLAIVLIYFNLYVVPENEVPTFLPLIAVLSLQFIFKRWGNLLLSGNLMCMLLFGVLSPTIADSGGLYSDNLVWISTVPILAFLLSNRWSGFIWLGIILSTLFYFYVLEINAVESYRNLTLSYPPIYYLVSWALLFIIISMMIFAFSNSKNHLIKSLIDSKKTILLQKEEATRQSDLVKQNEKELIVLNNKLEHFAIAISHDLKEPLRTIKMYTQVLEKKLSNSLTEKDREYMAFITNGTDRMHHLLVDLLSYVKLDESNSEKAKTPLADVFLLVKNNLFATIRISKATIRISSDLPTVYANQSQLVLLFQNLINNAIKFRHHDRNAHIEIYSSKDLSGNYIIHVKDNGIGIEEEYQERIFDLFARIHTKDQYEGVGIGLATCKKIMADMNGKIWVDSKVDIGTTFHLLFPQKNNTTGILIKQSNLPAKGNLTKSY